MDEARRAGGPEHPDGVHQLGYAGMRRMGELDEGPAATDSARQRLRLAWRWEADLLRKRR